MHTFQKGQRFKIKGMHDIYEVVTVASDKIVVTMSGIAQNFEVESGEAEECIDMGLWVILDPEPPSHMLGGLYCKSCNQYNDYASANQDDGSYKCYRCRNGI